MMPLSLTSLLVTSKQVFLKFFPWKGHRIYNALIVSFCLAEQISSRLRHEGIVNQSVFLFCLAKPARVPWEKAKVRWLEKGGDHEVLCRSICLSRF